MGSQRQGGEVGGHFAHVGRSEWVGVAKYELRETKRHGGSCRKGAQSLWGLSRPRGNTGQALWGKRYKRYNL